MIKGARLSSATTLAPKSATIGLLIGLIAAAPVTDAVEDLTTFDYEDMAANVASRRMLLSPIGEYCLNRAVLCSYELPHVDQSLRELMLWSIQEYRRVAETQAVTEL